MTLNEGDKSKSMPFERVNGRYRVEDYPWLATYRPADYPFYGETEGAQTVRDERDEYLDQLWSLVQKAGKSVAFQWPGVVEDDDVAQSIALRLLESPGSLEKIAGMDDRSRYRAIVGIGHQIASIERTDFDHFTGNFRYSVDEAKNVLKTGVLTDPVDGFGEAVLDLLEALEVLTEKTPRYADAVLSRYADNEMPSTSTESSTLSRALTSLTNEMNRSNRTRHVERDDGIGTRTVISNSASHVRSAQQYSGSHDPEGRGANTDGRSGW